MFSSAPDTKKATAQSKKFHNKRVLFFISSKKKKNVTRVSCSDNNWKVHSWCFSVSLSNEPSVIEKPAAVFRMCLKTGSSRVNVWTCVKFLITDLNSFSFSHLIIGRSLRGNSRPVIGQAPICLRFKGVAKKRMNEFVVGFSRCFFLTLSGRCVKNKPCDLHLYGSEYVE